MISREGCTKWAAKKKRCGIVASFLVITAYHLIALWLSRYPLSFSPPFFLPIVSGLILTHLRSSFSFASVPACSFQPRNGCETAIMTTIKKTKKKKAKEEEENRERKDGRKVVPAQRRSTCRSHLLSADHDRWAACELVEDSWSMTASPETSITWPELLKAFFSTRYSISHFFFFYRVIGSKVAHFPVVHLSNSADTLATIFKRTAKDSFPILSMASSITATLVQSIKQRANEEKQKK